MPDIRVLIVDDSPTVRSLFQRGLDRAAGIKVVGVAPDPYVARDMIVALTPDVITLDIEMPRMDGLTFLRKLMQHYPVPVVVVSSLTGAGSHKAIEALHSGAVEVVAKNMTADGINDVMLELVLKVKAAARASVVSRKGVTPTQAAGESRALPPLNGTGAGVIAIGSSTGGTEALASIFARLPANAPGTLVVQHMPPGFTAQMAMRLDGLSAMTVREAVDGEKLSAGLALVAPGDRHLLLRRHGGGYRVELRDGPRVNRHKPSVDVLFRTVAEVADAAAVGVILTGMGQDGAQGMLTMHQAGAVTIAQDEASCVVYGMPREAVELGAVDIVAPLVGIPERICRAVESLHAR